MQSHTDNDRRDAQGTGDPPPPPALEAIRLQKSYGDIVALRGVSVSVDPGQLLALVGESGSGKTTLLRCFNRTVEVDGGSVRVAGTDVRDTDPVALRRGMGYVPQEGGLLPHWTVARNVELVPKLRGVSDAGERARDALHKVGLDPDVFGARWPVELSGGQRQRVAIARALAGDPHVVLMDEPFGALDAITRSELQSAFADLRRESGISVVLVTHDLHEAFLLADVIAVMRDGSVEQVAAPTELREAPRTEYVALLLGKARMGAT